MPYESDGNIPKKDGDISLPKKHLIELFRDTVDRNPTKNALFFKGKFTTYDTLEKEVNQMASSLDKLGLRKGDRILVMMPNCPQFITTFFAAQSIGAIFVSVNPMLSSRELGGRIKDCTPKVIVTLDLFIDTVTGLDADASVEHIVIGSIGDALPPATKTIYKLINSRKKKTLEGAHSYKTLIENGLDRRKEVKIDPENDTAVLQYTGGTTGDPKGAMLTHHNLTSQAFILHHWRKKHGLAPPGEQYHIAGVLPYSHIFGLTSSFLWPIVEGATIFLIPDPRKLKEILKVIDRYEIHILNCVPVFFNKLGKHKSIDRYDLSSLQVCLSGGEGLPKETVELFEGKVDCVLIEGYGLTESSPVTHINPPEHTKRKIGSIGETIPLTESKLIDPETGEEIIEPGVPGELWVKGPGIMKGYWKNKDATDDVLKDGWLRTGDLVTYDGTGFYQIVDRLKELIIVSGFKVWPREVEDIIRNHPHIDDAVIVPMQTKDGGTSLKAVLIKKQEKEILKLDEVREFCKPKLAPYKVPKAIEYREELPRSMVGKVLRRELIRLLAEEQALSV